MKLEPFKTAVKLLMFFFIEQTSNTHVLSYFISLQGDKALITPKFSNKGIEYLHIYIRKYIQKHKKC